MRRMRIVPLEVSNSWLCLCILVRSSKVSQSLENIHVTERDRQVQGEAKEYSVVGHPTGDNDLDSGGGSGGSFQDHGSVCDPFDIVSTKSASVDSLERWRAAYLFQAHGEKDGTPKAPPSPIPTGNYNVCPGQVASMTRHHDFAALQNFGGVKAMAEMLKTNPDKGIDDDESNILDRKNRFLLDACRDTTLIISMVAAAASLPLGIKTEVVRGGRRVEISIFDIVVGDVIALKIGDQT
ncbi:hypothetical protein L2E82_08071 [Cichorium intybus]|uniref:Uncharacterized protein n=1 Tax=Cichorium intybus TaxID=13427 RepID=A0ACB9G5G9_CICIN|nr:hypothetical protein L2E82_08071 [Cichorium intybus]